MAYIAPDTNIMVLKNVPLDPTYDHTIYFGSANTQYAYFASKLKGVGYNFTRQSYQRLNRGWLRIACSADNLYDCNYIMFQNHAFGNKWFYAFIKTVEYVNDETSQIEYEIDDMQTWFFDYELEQCFVEREHVDNDTIGKHTVPESVELGEYVVTDLGLSQYFENTVSNAWSIVIVSTVVVSGTTVAPASGRLLGDVYTGLAYNVFTSYTDANTFIDTVTSDAAYGEDAILAIFMIPNIFATRAISTSYRQPYVDEIAKNISWTYLVNGVATTPKNNKLYTYPYNLLSVSNNEGSNAVFRYEFFGDANCRFGLRCALSSSPEGELIPLNYNGDVMNYNERLAITSFPLCTYITDAYKAWLALNSTKQTWEAIGSGIDTTSEILGMLAPSKSNKNRTGLETASQVVGEFGNIFHRVESIVAPRTVAKTMPPHAKGQSTQILNMAVGNFGYRYYNLHVRDEYAKLIDDYFSMFGYACHEVKVPNRNVRAYWTYTKTVGCVIKGSVPADSARKICSIYDNGITFWRYSANIDNTICNYSLNNAISL